MEDRTLTSTLREIIQAADDEECEFSSAAVKGWPDDALGLFDHIGIVCRGPNANGVVCDECEEQCWVEPNHRRKPNGEMNLVHCCEQRDDIGYVYFPIDALETWRVNHGEFARELSQTLDLNGEIKEIDKNRFWSLGSMQAGKKTRRFYLARGFHFTDGVRLAGIADEHHDADSFLFVFDRKPTDDVWRDPAGPIIRLVEVADIEDGELILDDVELRRVITKKQTSITPFQNPPDTTWEKIIIRALPPTNGDEEITQVQLQVGRRTETRNFVEMGMFDGRKQPPEPNSAWHLMLMIAKAGGELTWKDAGAGTNARAHMKLLRHNLRDVFQLKGDPFKDYKPGEGWKVRFTLTDLSTSP